MGRRDGAFSARLLGRTEAISASVPPSTQLFIGARTVEWRLHKVFAKLDISSRRELAEALGRAGSAVTS